MQREIRASLFLAALVTLLSAVIQLTGLNKSFLTGSMVFLAGAILLNVIVVVRVLSQNASQNSYGQQLLSASVIGVVAGVLIVIASWFLLSFIFPDALNQMAAAAIQHMQEINMPEEKVRQQMEMLGNTTPMSQSIPGGIGTFLTSLVTGALTAVFKRRK